MATIAWARDLRHVYPDGTEVAFVGEPFVVERGERVALIGPNGSGKTTLLFHLAGLLRPTGGEVQVLGHDPARQFEHVRERIGVLLQNPEEQILMPTVAEDIAFAARNAGLAPAEVKRRVECVAAELEIGHLLGKISHYLSGGEKIKVAMAGALVLDPELLILDEPFEGLDTVAKTHLITLINSLRDERGLGVVLSTHELNLIPYFADTVYLLAPGGQVVARGTPAEVLGRPEILCGHGHDLEPPVLTRLFTGLRAHGIDLPMALTVEEAVDRIARAMENRTP